MSEYTPTIEQFRGWLSSVVKGQRDDAQVQAEFNRMIAEVERAAAEKALVQASERYLEGLTSPELSVTEQPSDAARRTKLVSERLLSMAREFSRNGGE